MIKKPKQRTQKEWLVLLELALKKAKKNKSFAKTLLQAMRLIPTNKWQK